MKARIGWLLRQGRAHVTPPDTSADTVAQAGIVSLATDSGGVVAEELVLSAPDQTAEQPPEQPVLLMPTGEARPVHVGELVPAPRPRWRLSVVRVPVVPKRAILAAGLCVGLAAPGIARHMVTRLLVSRPSSRAEGVLEITRIVYSGPLTPRAVAAIGRALAPTRQ
jgi:hypothetical protein